MGLLQKRQGRHLAEAVVRPLFVVDAQPGVVSARSSAIDSKRWALITDVILAWNLKPGHMVERDL